MEEVEDLEEVKFESFTLKLNEKLNTYTITDCEKDIQSVTIPIEVNGIKVTKIGDFAFQNCTKLESVIFPMITEENVDLFFLYSLEIGCHAFDNCISLKSIEIPDYICLIDRSAFRNCTALVSAIVPKCYIAPFAFYHCESLKSITPISLISEGLFSHCKSLENIPTNSKTTEIEEDAFEHCYSLTDIVIHKNIKSIGPEAFSNCHNLKSVTFEDPNGWFFTNRYVRKEFELDLSNPEHNAKMLSSQDFDDGNSSWYKK